jgi:long-chain fatty acid transport protein
MQMRMLTRSLISLAALCVGVAPAAIATDGHFLHGVGAVNAAMGGAGVAVNRSLLGTFYLNPSGLMAYDGARVEFGFELFKPDRTTSADLPGFASGSTTSKSDWVPIPAMGLSYRLKNDRVVLGLGALGIGGFGVDYAASSIGVAGVEGSPLLLPQPNGFGAIFSNYSFLKISPTAAVALSPKLWLGGAINVDWASLAVQPMPTVAPACTSMTGPCYYPSAAATDGAFGVGFQLGLTYNINDLVAVGLSYTSPQWFSAFEFNSAYANPDLPSFGAPLTIEFTLDVPQIFAAGVGLKPLPGMTIGLDGRYITYESTKGFSGSGFNADGSVAGFGWQNIFVLAVGGEYWLSDRVALRAGYNYSQNPVPDSLSFFNIPAPAIVQNHVTLGAGYKVSRRVQIDLGYYHAFENTITGPIPNPAVPPGSTVSNSLSEDSILLQFTVGAK